MPGVCPGGGVLKLRSDWYISLIGVLNNWARLEPILDDSKPRDKHSVHRDKSRKYSYFDKGCSSKGKSVRDNKDRYYREQLRFAVFQVRGSMKTRVSAVSYFHAETPLASIKQQLSTITQYIPFDIVAYAYTLQDNLSQNGCINISGHSIVWFTLRVSHTKTQLNLLTVTFLSI